MRVNRTAAELFIVLPSIVDRYSETYGPTGFEYCLPAALLGPNRSSLAGNGGGESHRRTMLRLHIMELDLEFDLEILPGEAGVRFSP
jgi:hypothetical protein